MKGTFHGTDISIKYIDEAKTMAVDCKTKFYLVVARGA